MPSDEDYAAMAYGRGNREPHVMKLVEAGIAREKAASQKRKLNRDMAKLTVDSGSQLIAAERQRQIDEEGWTKEHDAQHTHGSLAGAAISYILFNYPTIHHLTKNFWPWEWVLFKPDPQDTVRNLAKAGALIAAEIDRINLRNISRNPIKAAQAKVDATYTNWMSALKHLGDYDDIYQAWMAARKELETLQTGEE